MYLSNIAKDNMTACMRLEPSGAYKHIPAPHTHFIISRHNNVQYVADIIHNIRKASTQAGMRHLCNHIEPPNTQFTQLTYRILPEEKHL